MSHVCTQCSRINPVDATYCYWDGAILAGRAGAGPINAGSAPFPNQFIFPSGKMCRNFDQLATTSQQNWQEAVDLLKQGFLATFLGGLGRTDLAMAANEAAKFPDPDRGLDMLLSRLPTQVLQAPKLKVEPSEVNLGQVKMGQDRNMELHLSNMGMRLLYGSVASDSKWLTFGEGHAAQKLFQFGQETVIPLHVKGQHLRAGNQPLEGQLVVESNGGSVTVTVKADVPITPFNEGVLAGSYTPRQIAEKARAHPKEAAALFEKAMVAQWFAKNGWIYPVQGPTVSGMGGVQQFFEALGLAKPPKVELKTPAIHLRGNVGQVLAASIEVTTAERKQVYAWGVSDQPWADVSKTKSEGRNATITATVTVPYAPGQTVQANITVTGNGNQRFQVPLMVTVGATVPPGYTPTVQAIPVSSGVGAPMMASVADDAVMALPVAGAPLMAAVMPAQPGYADYASAPPPVPSAGVMAAPPPVPPPMPGMFAPPTDDGAIVAATSHKKRDAYPFWVHVLPLAMLAITLLVLMIRDLMGTPTGGADSADGGPVDPMQRIAVYFDFGKKESENSMRFGLTMLDRENANNPNPKRLTYDHLGRTNSTVISIDGVAKGFGRLSDGKWLSNPEDLKSIPMALPPSGSVKSRSPGKTATWHLSPDPIYVTQTVAISPGEAVELTPGVFKRQLDTCLVKYKIENKDNRPRTLGLRVMVDTLIGMNDGTPFTIPGSSGLVDTLKDFDKRQEIPDFIQALEEANLEAPGTTVQMNLKLSDKLAPDRASLTFWPGRMSGLWNWDVPMMNITQPGPHGSDSCIVLYWNPTSLKPGETRECGFSYGLGSLSGKGGKLGITVGGSLVKGGELTVVAYVADPALGQMASIEFLSEDAKNILAPDGKILQLLPDSPATQPVIPAAKSADGKLRPSPVTWRIRALAPGTPTIRVRSTVAGPNPVNLEQSRKITIRQKGIF